MAITVFIALHRPWNSVARHAFCVCHGQRQPLTPTAPLAHNFCREPRLFFLPFGCSFWKSEGFNSIPSPLMLSPSEPAPVGGRATD